MIPMPAALVRYTVGGLVGEWVGGLVLVKSLKFKSLVWLNGLYPYSKVNNMTFYFCYISVPVNLVD